MMDQTTNLYLRSFARRADQRLGLLARELAGALAGGDEARRRALRLEGLLLTHGLHSCDSESNQLTGQQRLYIAGKLLPLLSDISTEMEADTVALTLRPLLPRYRGQANTDTLPIQGEISGTVPAGAELVISRDGVQLRRLPATVGRFELVDVTPGARYRAEVTGTPTSQERVRPLRAAILAGVGPANAGSAFWQRLPLAGEPVADKLRLRFTGTQQRILLCVPVERGSVHLLTQPDDQDADITMAFDRQRVTLDFGADGRAEYELLQNYAPFTGTFELDAHLPG